jgi:hypothetical protein
MLTLENKAAIDCRQDLGNGLIARWSTAADVENISQLASIVFRDKEEELPNTLCKETRILPLCL